MVVQERVRSRVPHQVVQAEIAGFKLPLAGHARDRLSRFDSFLLYSHPAYQRIRIEDVLTAAVGTADPDNYERQNLRVKYLMSGGGSYAIKALVHEAKLECLLSRADRYKVGVILTVPCEEARLADSGSLTYLPSPELNSHFVAYLNLLAGKYNQNGNIFVHPTMDRGGQTFHYHPFDSRQPALSAVVNRNAVEAGKNVAAVLEGRVVVLAGGAMGLCLLDSVRELAPGARHVLRENLCYSNFEEQPSLNGKLRLYGRAALRTGTLSLGLTGNHRQVEVARLSEVLMPVSITDPQSGNLLAVRHMVPLPNLDTFPADEQKRRVVFQLPKTTN